MMTARLDPFEALGVPRDASTATIKARYYELAKRYHPNRHQGSDESKHALVEHFYIIQQAWKLLMHPESRRRYVELLELLEQQQELLSGMTDLLEESQRKEHRVGQGHDGHLSSDGDEDTLPRIGLARRRTNLERSMSMFKHSEHLGDEPGVIEKGFRRGGRIGSLLRRVQARDSAFDMPSLSTKGASKDDDDYFNLRRKKLEKLRKKEGRSFLAYRDAMLHKFEAELAVEQCRQDFELARWKRRYFEMQPRETAERFRSFQRFMGAVQAFNQPKPIRRSRKVSQIVPIEQGPETGQYLHPSQSTRRRSLHKRGWSSDVSGDQTSSDEGSSDSSRHISWSWHQKKERPLSLDAFRRSLDPQQQDSPHRERSPNSNAPGQAFKLLVKRPTGFTDVLDGHRESSSPDSSSRPPSPFPGSDSLHKFTLLQPSKIADFLGTKQDREALKDLLGPDSQRIDARAPLPDATPHDFDPQALFEIKHIGRAYARAIPVENVHLLSYEDKVKFLDTQPGGEEPPAEILARLRSFDANVADGFILKPDIKKDFRFRLLYTSKEAPQHQHLSFIALSYRRKRQVSRRDGFYSLPLEPEMFQALCDERTSENEGIWIDQISIDQDSQEEKTISMSAMDIVYRQSRLAVVVLDDIELSASEGEILQSHMNEYATLHHVAPEKRFRGKQPPYLETRDDLYHVLQALLRSSWFTRAWCRHEMRLARQHVFLVPCRSPGTWTGKSVVRFTGQCLSHLLSLSTEVSFDGPVENVKPALCAFFRERSKLQAWETLKLHHGNFSSVVAEVFSMDTGGDPSLTPIQRAADAMKDKISIILNTMECGLALASRVRARDVSLSKQDCLYMLQMLALAARDPGVLCSVGPPMRLIQPEAVTPTVSSTWLFEPTVVDSGLNNHRTLEPFSREAHISTQVEHQEHSIGLDLKFLQPAKAGKVLHAQAPNISESLDLAQRITDICDTRRLGRYRYRYLISNAAANRHFGDMHEVYVHTLACVLQAGPDWIEEICTRYGVSRWKIDLKPTYELLLALKNTCGRWPEHAWSNQALGFLMDFVNFLIVRGMPQRQILHDHVEKWRPVFVALENHGKVVTFVPPGRIETAVPTVLLESAYSQLARLWILQPRAEDDDTWTLLGKSVMFSDHLAVQKLHSTEGGNWRAQQKVFGREVAGGERDLHF